VNKPTTPIGQQIAERLNLESIKLKGSILELFEEIIIKNNREFEFEQYDEAHIIAI
jgi:hypothetical protein